MLIRSSLTGTLAVLAALLAIGISRSPAGRAQENPCATSTCAVSIEKERVGSGDIDTDDVVTYDLTVTNTGDVPLVDVDVNDQYTLHLDFEEADPDPNLWLGDDGLLQWLDLEDDAGGQLDPGESVTLSVAFTAVEPGDGENCAYVLAGPAAAPSVLVEGNPSCVLTEIGGQPSDGGDNNRPERIPTPTPRASVTVPVPAATAATVVPAATAPPAASPTRAGGVIIAGPDTGQGTASGRGGAAGWMWVAASLAAIVGSGSLALARRLR